MTLTYNNGMVSLHRGDARSVLAELPAESVHCVVTSPPYWGLRDYGLEPSVWETPFGMASDETEHEWGEPIHGKSQSGSLTGSTLSGAPPGKERRPEWGSASCWKCGAWRGTLGLEPTPELYVQHIVEIFREVRRVLRKDGTLWLNLGDSYAGSWGAQSRSNGNDVGSTLEGGSMLSARQIQAAPRGQTHTGSLKDTPGLKPKDLVGIPWKVVFALQAEGWWHRFPVVWKKDNPMPSSARDRPTMDYEFMFLLTKSARYYYDAEAIREPGITGDMRRPYGSNGAWKMDGRPESQKHGGEHRENAAAGRNKRGVWAINTEPFGMDMCGNCGVIFTAAQKRRMPTMEWQDLDIETEEMVTRRGKQCRRCKRGDSWSSHFATFPTKLVEPCILAGTSEQGVCAECGAPLARVIEIARSFESGSGRSGNPPIGKNGANLQGGGETGDIRRGPVTRTNTTGWRPTCDHHDAPTEPATVLDPFGGSGTVGAVAQSLGRRAILIDLSADYLKLAERRIGAVPLPLVNATNSVGK